MRAALAVLALLVVAAPLARAADSPAEWGTWTEFTGAVSAWRLDSTQVADVASVILEREYGSIALESGRIAIARELGGRRCAFVFVGHGTLAYAPPTEIERQQLRRFYDVTRVRRPFTSLVVLCTDSTLNELQAVATFRRDTVTTLRRAWTSVLPYLVDRETNDVKVDAFANAVLDGEPGWFWAAAWEGKQDPMFFTLDPYDVEGVQLRRPPEGERQGLLRLYRSEVVTQSRRAADSDSLATDVRPPWELRHAVLDVTLASDLALRGTARLDVEGHGLPRHWLEFSLDHKLRVESATAAGKPLAFHQDREGYFVQVRCDPPIQPGETRTIELAWHGQAFERETDGRIYMDPALDWYPDAWYGENVTWDATFHWPRDYQLLASGERQDLDTRGPVHSARWITTRPVPWIAFDISFLRGLEVKQDSLPALTVWERRTDGAGRVRSTTLPELSKASAPQEKIARDVARALQFYVGAFGEPVQPSLHALEVSRVQMSGRGRPTWQSYPGLLRMMVPEDKLGTGVEWTPDFIRAHELAHQWWGGSARPATYHDRWLSEGFADFCAIWYLQAGRQDAKAYFATLDEWQERLLENRRFLLGNGQQAGPIWLGSRTNSSSTPGDYGLIVYNKGAWVLHMLRNMLLDLDTQDETRFRALMRDFYASHRHGRTRTREFARAAAAAAGEDLSWFFSQWVYGTDVPTYTTSWSATHSPGGWVVKGRVAQTNVPDAFRMPMIVRVDFGGQRFARTRVWVEGPVTEFELPPVPDKPEEVVFNDLHSVLAEVKRAK